MKASICAIVLFFAVPAVCTSAAPDSEDTFHLLQGTSWVRQVQIGGKKHIEYLQIARTMEYTYFTSEVETDEDRRLLDSSAGFMKPAMSGHWGQAEISSEQIKLIPLGCVDTCDPLAQILGRHDSRQSELIFASQADAPFVSIDRGLSRYVPPAP